MTGLGLGGAAVVELSVVLSVVCRVVTITVALPLVGGMEVLEVGLVVVMCEAVVEGVSVDSVVRPVTKS